MCASCYAARRDSLSQTHTVVHPLLLIRSRGVAHTLGSAGLTLTDSHSCASGHLSQSRVAPNPAPRRTRSAGLTLTHIVAHIRPPLSLVTPNPAPRRTHSAGLTLLCLLHGPPPIRINNHELCCCYPATCYQVCVLCTRRLAPELSTVGGRRRESPEDVDHNLSILTLARIGHARHAPCTGWHCYRSQPCLLP